MSVVTFIIGALLLLDLIWWFAADRLLQSAGFRHRARLIHSSFFVLQVGGLLAVIPARRSEFWDGSPKAIASAVYIWHLLILPPLLPFLLIGLLVVLVIWLVRKLKARAGEIVASPNAEGASGISRRAFFASTAAFAPQVLTIGLTGVALRQLEQFRVRPITVAVRDLPAALDGLTIAHVTDIHAGRFTRSAVLQRMAAAVNDLRADLVLVTGDLINGALHELPEGIETVRRFDARSGVYMIEGNHDLFPGREAFETRVRASGIRLLVNESEPLSVRGHPLQLLGLRWGGPGFGRREGSGDAAIAASFAELIALRDPEAFPVLLAHHPHAFDAAVAAQLPLTLSGHTHGGQLMLSAETGFGPMMFRYWSGLYTQGNSHLIVSNGVGNWFPLRTSAPAEIIHVTLRRA
jgi:predicted MPP superfamily phosphohydrolase